MAGSSSGLSGDTSLLLTYPKDLVLDSMGNMYVADEDNQRIQLFLSGQLNGTTIVGVIGISGNSSFVLNGPCALDIDDQLDFYVVDFNNARIQKFLHY